MNTETKKLFEANHARMLAVVEGLRPSWPTDALREVEEFLEHHEFALAVSAACALARDHGYGSVRAEMLALADAMGEHDYTPDARHPLDSSTAG